METKVYDLTKEWEEGLAAGAKVLQAGGLVGFPTETVYGLGADAKNDEAVRSIFAAKGRPQDNPLIVHIAHPDQAEEVAKDISPLAKKLMKAFWPGPFTAVLPRRPGVCEAASAGIPTIGLRLPAHPAARELIEKSGRLIAAPSANLSGKPSPTHAAHVLEDMQGRIPVILDGGPSHFGLESTVCDLTGPVPVLLRPGGVTAEQIREVAGDCKLASAVLEALKEGEQAASPGMKYKHYAPRAKVFVVGGCDTNTIANKAISMYDREEKKNRKVEIFCCKDNAPRYENRRVCVLGQTEDQIAARLFDALRAADARQVDTILFESVGTDGMGLAVMNRILRAAGFDVL